MSNFDFLIRTQRDLERAVDEYGFLPFFKNSIPGFSVAEHVAPEAWFGSEEGVWEWKGPVIRAIGCGYGKFFEKKAAFVSREWFCDFANYRRDGYDFDSLFEEGLAPYGDRDLFRLIDEHGPISTARLKRMGNYGKQGRKGFDTVITRLQAQCYAVISDFVYLEDRFGMPYGWGMAQYATPERVMGESFRAHVYDREPEESRERILDHLQSLFPEAERKKLEKFLG